MHNQPLLPRHVRQLWRGRLATVLIFLVAGVITEILNRTELARLETYNRSIVLNQAATLRAALDSELNSALFVGSGLIGYIEVHQTLNIGESQEVLAAIFHQGHHLRNIALAPDNRIKVVYPLQGNEAVVGLFYPDLPMQWPAVKTAIERRETVLAGPIELIQGGVGLIARTPVFLRNGRYWGLISIVLDADELLTHAGIVAERDGIRYALRGKDAQGANGPMILGDPVLFKSDAVLLSIKVPGGEWQLAAQPVNGWQQGDSHLLWYRIGGWLLALLIAILYYRSALERLHVELVGLLDTLTELPNRRLFEDRLQQLLVVSERHDEQFALLYLDLDGFKPINDRYGHKVGDSVLIEVATRLRLHLRKADTIARIGGDEFVMLLPRLVCVEEAVNVAHKLLAAVTQPMELAGVTLHVGASIGISIYPDHGVSAEELLKSADHAMYAVKTSGKGGVDVAIIDNTMNKAEASEIS